MTENKKPNLLICGAQKSGTTWLHNQLKQHRDIFGTQVKELNFFNQTEAQIKHGFDGYLESFDQESPYIYRMESTPHYFWRQNKDSVFANPVIEIADPAEMIEKYLGTDIHLIVMLRDPVSRAISAYHHNYAMGRNNSCRRIFDGDPDWGVIELSFYRRHIEHWDKIFGDRMHYYLFDDIAIDPVSLVNTIISDLGLPHDTSVADYAARKVRMNTREDIIKRNDEVIQKEFPKLNQQEVGALLSLFLPDIRYVEERLGINLPHWRNIYKVIELNQNYIK